MFKFNYRQWLPLMLLLSLAVVALELWTQQQQAHTKLVASQQETQQIAHLSQTYRTLVGNRTVPSLRFNKPNQATAWLTKQAQQQGLPALSVQVSSTDNTIRLTFEVAHFNRLVQWLQNAEMQSNLVVTQAQLKAHENPGFVTGKLSFEIN